jgi:nitrogen fixation NifU-like protein
MSDLDDLYQEVILDHQRNPRNFVRLPNANRQAEGNNPLCGDHVTVYLDIENGLFATSVSKAKAARSPRLRLL